MEQFSTLSILGDATRGVIANGVSFAPWSFNILAKLDAVVSYCDDAMGEEAAEPTSHMYNLLQYIKKMSY